MNLESDCTLKSLFFTNAKKSYFSLEYRIKKTHVLF